MWGGIEPAHVAHLLVALCAAVVVGWLRCVADVEAGLAERTTSFGFRVWDRLLLLLLLLWLRLLLQLLPLLLLRSWGTGPLLHMLGARGFTCPRPRTRLPSWLGGLFWGLLLRLGGLRDKSTGLVKKRGTKTKQLSKRLLRRWGLS